MSQILIVEDQIDSAEALRQFLLRRGYSVRTAINGETALRAVLNNQLQLLVLDLSMPGLNGVELLEIIRSYLRFQKLAVVVWTGVDDPALIKKAEALGVMGVVRKGQADYSQLLNAISQLLPPKLGDKSPSLGIDDPLA